MRKTVLLSLTALIIVSTTYAQPGRGGKDRKPPSIEERMERLFEAFEKHELDLTDNEKGTVEEAYLKFFKGMDELREASERPDRMDVARLSVAREEAIENALSKDKYVHYEEIRKSFESKIMARRSHGRGR